MDRYTKVEQKKPNIPINENEIRITSQGLVRNYISYATTLLQERRGKEIVLKAMGQAISKTVAIAEIIKRNIPRLHQDTHISSISITDVWEPIEEGLLPVEMTRQVSMISITLSTKELNKSSPGYQAPLFVERPRQQYNNYQRQQPRQGQAYNIVNEEPYGGNYHGNRGRGQGGVRGGRGRGWNRGGYGNQGGGGYGSYQGDGYRNYQGGGGYGSYQGGRGYGNYRGGRYQGGGEYGNNQGGGEYGNYQDNNGFSNRGRGGGRGGNAGYRGGGGYMRGGGGGSRGGGGGRFNGRGRGRMGGRPRDAGDPQQQ